MCRNQVLRDGRPTGERERSSLTEPSRSVMHEHAFCIQAARGADRVRYDAPRRPYGDKRSLPRVCGCSVVRTDSA